MACRRSRPPGAQGHTTTMLQPGRRLAYHGLPKNPVEYCRKAEAVRSETLAQVEVRAGEPRQ